MPSRKHLVAFGDIWPLNCWWHLVDRGHRYYQTACYAQQRPSQQKVMWSQMTIVPRLRNPDLEYIKSVLLLNFLNPVLNILTKQFAEQKPLEKIVLDFWDCLDDVFMRLFQCWNNYFCIATWNWSIWIYCGTCFHIIWKETVKISPPVEPNYNWWTKI